MGFVGSVGFGGFFCGWLILFGWLGLVLCCGFFLVVSLFLVGGGGVGWVLNFCLFGGFLFGFLFWLWFCSVNSC